MLRSLKSRKKITNKEPSTLKIAAKPLQMETWLLLTANRKSPALYPMVRSQTPYNLSFSHNTARLTF